MTTKKTNQSSSLHTKQKHRTGIKGLKSMKVHEGEIILALNIVRDTVHE